MGGACVWSTSGCFKGRPKGNRHIWGGPLIETVFPQGKSKNWGGDSPFQYFVSCSFGRFASNMATKVPICKFCQNSTEQIRQTSEIRLGSQAKDLRLGCPLMSHNQNKVLRSMLQELRRRLHLFLAGTAPYVLSTWLLCFTIQTMSSEGPLPQVAGHSLRPVS